MMPRKRFTLLNTVGFSPGQLDAMNAEFEEITEDFSSDSLEDQAAEMVLKGHGVVSWDDRGRPVSE